MTEAARALGLPLIASRRRRIERRRQPRHDGDRASAAVALAKNTLANLAEELIEGDELPRACSAKRRSRHPHRPGERLLRLSREVCRGTTKHLSV